MSTLNSFSDGDQRGLDSELHVFAFVIIFYGYNNYTTAGLTTLLFLFLKHSRSVVVFLDVACDLFGELDSDVSHTVQSGNASLLWDIPWLSMRFSLVTRDRKWA